MDYRDATTRPETGVRLGNEERHMQNGYVDVKEDDGDAEHAGLFDIDRTASEVI